MNVAILHFHLNPGGVTRIVENHLLALDAAVNDRLRVAIFSGGRNDGWHANLAKRLTNIEVSLHAIPGLDYDDVCPTSPKILTENVTAELARLGFQPDDTVLHVHNHALGKNLSLPVTLKELATAGWRLLLQIHDFSEDYRPHNYRRLKAAFGDSYSQVLYPQASQIHYAVLNRRDYDVLASAGVTGDRLHCVPNPVPDLPILRDREAARRTLERNYGIGVEQHYTLYPVRGIRRKNIGEALLLSLLSRNVSDRQDHVFGLALAPLNPREKAFYDRWLSVASDLNCPFRFETGGSSRHGLLFADHLAAADAAVTTSVAEGFGMTFLEPWLAGLPLTGRNLPDITSDFRAAGVGLDGLYDRLDVPLDWIGPESYADSFRTAGEALLAAYEQPLLPMRTWLDIFESKTAGGRIDFGDLDEPLQEVVLRQVAADRACGETLRALNPHLEATPDSARVSRNRERIRSAFAPEPIGRQLIGIYSRLIDSGVQSIRNLECHQVILGRLLDLRRFRLVRGVA